MRALEKLQAVVVALMFSGAGLAQTAQQNAPVKTANSGTSCPVRSVLLNFDIYRRGELVGGLPVYHLRGDSAFFFSAGMAIDADGAPNAYNAENSGLDDLSNAGEPGHWDGVLQDRDGNPLIQGPDDPFPGYYISCTALADWTKDRLDPTRFVDASKIPYIALPGDLARQTGARLGDLTAVYNMRNGKYSYAIFADIGALGEGSIALADDLGLWPDARRGGTWGGIVYVVFPGSGNHRPKTLGEINALTGDLFQSWGGPGEIPLCADAETWRRMWSQGNPWWGARYTQPAKAAEPASNSGAATGANSNATTN